MFSYAFLAAVLSHKKFSLADLYLRQTYHKKQSYQLVYM